jgi:NTE family protein
MNPGESESMSHTRESDMDITVALGGGGARGLSHIGVLEVLEEEGFRIRAIAGTSMGGIIAACYASGLSPREIETRAGSTPLRGLLQVRPTGDGLLGLEHVAEFLHDLLGDRTFDDMRIPLAVTATDLTTCQEIVLTEGNVAEAVLATIAMPGIFPPRVQGEHRLVDGAVLDPVPVAPARRLFPGVVFAVVLSPSQEQWPEARSPNPLEVLPGYKVITRLRPAQALQVFMQAMEISSRMHTELRLKIDRPEVLVRPEVWRVPLLDDPSLADMIEAGRSVTREALPDLRQQFVWWRRAGRALRRVAGRIRQ